MSDAIARIDSWLAETEAERLADYLDFLRIPSIGSLSEHQADVVAAARFLAERLAGEWLSALP